MISSVGNKGLPPQINASAYWANCWSPVPLSLEPPGLSMVLTHYHGCASTVWWHWAVVVVTIGQFKHSGGGDNPKPGVGDTRPSWWWHQGSSPITQLLLTSSGPCKQFSTRLRLRYWSSVSPRGTTNTPSVRKSGSKLGSIGKVEGVDWLSWRVEVVDWWPHLKPGSKPGLGRLAGGGRVSPNRLRPDITFANTKLPAITLSVTKTLVCTEPGPGCPPMLLFLVNISSSNHAMHLVDYIPGLCDHCHRTRTNVFLFLHPSILQAPILCIWHCAAPPVCAVNQFYVQLWRQLAAKGCTASRPLLTRIKNFIAICIAPPCLTL